MTGVLLMVSWCALAAALLFMLCIASEAAARFFLARSRYYVWPPYYCIENHLNADVFPGLDSKAVFRVNSEGERGSEPPRSKNGLYRILVIGGSAAECYFLDQEACWSMRLERRLNIPAALDALQRTRVHVGSVARSGIDCAKATLVLRRVCRQHEKIDTVVMMIGAAEVLSWLRNGAPEYPELELPEPLHVFESSPEQRFAWFPPKRTALSELFRILDRRFVRRKLRRSGVGTSVARLRKMRQQAKTVKSEVTAPTAMLCNFEKALESCIAICKKAGARVLVVAQPWLDANCLTKDEESRLWFGAEGDPHSQSVSTYYSAEVFSQLMMQVNSVAARVAQENGAEIVQMQSRLQPPAACFYDDAHFTPYGAAIVAEIVSNTVLQHPVASPLKN
jgi:hypothetical protein